MKLTVDIGTILDEVVNQFSDPMTFYRELVQNAIDAGSGAIEIDLSYDAGRALVEFVDWGEGMTRQIIETKLVRLFSSGKDDDLTKIGRFGIGFVSVFAIEPDAVVVDTGREGEYWRVLFGPDRTYELFALDKPVEGTTIQIHKSMSRAQFREFEKRTHKVVRKWCKHAEIPITVQGFETGESFEIDSHLGIEHREQGTRVVMGFVEQGSEFAGYYNRGLTLKETNQSPFEAIAFKIDSRYLEHTLTRDQLLEDSHYAKAEELLTRLARRDLPEHLIDRIEELAAVEEHGPEEAAEYEACGGYLNHFRSREGSFRRGWSDRKLFRDSYGRAVSLKEIRSAHRRWKLTVARRKGPLADALVGSGEDRLLLILGEGDGFFNFIANSLGAVAGGLGTDFFFIEDRYFLLSELDESPESASKALKNGLKVLAGEVGASLEDLRFAHFRGLPPAWRNSTAVVVPKTKEPITVSQPRRPTTEDLWGRQCILVNSSDAEVRKLMEVAETEPEFAAMALLRLICSTTETNAPQLDALIRAAVKGRTRRLSCRPRPGLD